MSRPAVRTASACLRGAFCRAQVWLYGSALFLVTVAVAVGADDNKVFYPAGSAKAAAPASAGGSVANMFSLIVALVIAAVGAWLFWKNRKAQAAGNVSHSLAVEETKSLGNRQYLVVASYEGRKFLLGVCPGRIDMLAPLNEGEKRTGA